jgi:type 1 glutamine amidotransferase
MTRMLRSLAAVTVVAAGAGAFWLPPPAALNAQGKTIVFLAGPKDHGVPGRHEYEKDLRALAKCLEGSPNLKGITTKVFVGKAPRDIAELKDAAAIVIESSSDRDERETHPLFPPEPTTRPGHTYDAETLAYLKEVDGLVKNGMGVVILHYANWVEHWVARRYYLDWTGGLWVQGGSRNPNDQWTMTFENPEHPVLRGVKPWTYRDEMFCRFMLPVDLKRTNLLIGTPAKAPTGPQVVSWAYERPEGGRGFVMGGVDFHDNLRNVEDYRRFLLNGIVWAAKMDVPVEGVQSTPPAESNQPAAGAPAGR